MISTLLAIVLLVFFSSVSPVISAQTDKVDEYISREMKRRRTPGLALVAIQHGKVVKMKGYGLANVELDVPVTPDTVFHLASLTKQFTATAIMLLVEESKVRLDNEISHYLPRTPARWKGITVRNLLTHTAGMPGPGLAYRTLPPGNFTAARMFEAATADTLGSRPGEQWQYSNLGYFLLGMIIEKASNQGYREFLTERFFKPLGMDATLVPDRWAIIKNRADGYTLRDGQLVPFRYFPLAELPSDGGIYSTVKDLVKWDNALGAGKIVKKSSLDQMWMPVRLQDGISHPYGFGWEIDERRSHKLITHRGSTGTEYSRYPDEGLTVIVLTNVGLPVNLIGPEVDPWGFTEGVAAHYIPGLRFGSLKAQTDPNPGRTEQLRELLTSIINQEDSPLMTVGLLSSVGQNENVKNITASRLKGVKSFTFLACDDVQGRRLDRYGEKVSRACYYKMKTGSATYYYTFWMTPKGWVADFQSSTE